MKKTVSVIGASLFAISMLTAPVMAGGLDGVWRTPKGWKVKLYKCGAAYCGRVIGGTKDKDVHNPKKSMRSRKVVGIRMIWGMKKNGKKYSGKLYNPKDGKTYSGKITPVSASSIKLAGCVFGGLICKSQTWRK